ncbi:Cullin-1 [Thelohanellus kitauei]|uniref:Cullin-1 n=1 Tax=Thelohanellus kitauei TaxID=669202 RepID=A0A0C2MMP6_THEKT|nr:Cullin-1 [Thelohanellus kitauei]
MMVPDQVFQNTKKELGLTNSLASIITGISKILSGYAPTPAQSMGIYNEIYNYCTITDNSRSNQLYEEDVSFQGTNCHFLFEKLCALLSQRFDSLCRDISSNFYPMSNRYLELWSQTEKSACIINTICSYLNRNWVSQQRSLTSNRICTFYELVIVEWTKKVFYTFHVRLIDEFLIIVSDDRCGKASDLWKLKLFCDHMQILRVDLADHDYSSKLLRVDSIFKEEFVSRFLHATENYLLSISREAFSHNDPLGYLLTVKKVMISEVTRTTEYISEGLVDQMRTLIENTCIKPHLEAFYQMVREMITRNYWDGVKYFYEIVSKIPTVIDQLKGIVVSELKLIVLSRIEALGPDKCNPEMFMPRLHEIFTQYDERIKSTFINDVVFEDLKNQAYSYLINNCFDIHGSLKISTLLARYINIMMTKNADSSRCLRSIPLFQTYFRAVEFLRDKDDFKTAYIHYLSKRLISSSTRSFPIEEEIITELTSRFGEELTDDMMKMCSDIGTSQMKNQRFYEERPAPIINPPYFQLLFTGSWPLTHKSDLILPPGVREFYEKFEGWFLGQEKSKKLKFLDHLSLVDLKMRFRSGEYYLNVTGFHATVILLFKGVTEIDLGTILSSTGLNKEMMFITLHSLISRKVLVTNSNLLDSNPEDMNLDWTFRLNSGFEADSKFLTIKLPFKILETTKVEVSSRRKYLEKGFSIQSSILKELKNERSLQAEFLTSRIMDSLSQLDVTRSEIYDNLHTLIEREHITFDPVNKTYSYTACDL